MTRNITTNRISEAQIWSELSHLVRYFQTKRIATCELTFGWAWGLEYYSDDWHTETVQLEELEEKIRAVEIAGLGHFADDDVFIKCEDMTFTFCHESDIHLTFSRESDITKYFYKRWQSIGYQPVTKKA